MVEYDSQNNSLFDSTKMMDLPSKWITKMIDIHKVGFTQFVPGEHFMIAIN